MVGGSQRSDRTPFARQALHRPARPEYGHERGVGGSRVSGGRFIDDEHNPDLLDVRSRMLVYREMRRSSAAVHSGAMVRKTTLLAGERVIAPTGDQPLHIMGAELCAEVLGLRGPTLTQWAALVGESFESILSRQAEFEYDGFRYQEVIWGVRRSQALGRTVTVPVRIADRAPAAHKEWLTLDGGDLDAVLQHHVSGHNPPQPIPRSKLLLTVFNQTAGNWAGVGMARPAWYWWRAAQEIANSGLIAVDRWASPVVRIRTNLQLLAALKGSIDAEIFEKIEVWNEALKGQAEGFRALENAYIADNDGVEATTFGEGVLDTSGPLAFLQYCDSQISRVFLAQHLELGVTDAGAKNVGEMHESIFRRSIRNTADLIASAFDDLFRQIMRFNFGPAAEAYAPRLDFRGMAAGPIVELAPILAQLMQITGPDGTLPPQVEAVVQGLLDVAGIRHSGTHMAEAMAATGDDLSELEDGEAIDETWVKPAEAGRLISASPASLQTMYARGQIRRIKVNGRVRYKTAEVLAAVGLEGGT